jgi:hypothetical protein
MLGSNRKALIWRYKAFSDSHFGPSGLSAISQNYVSTINGIFFSSLSLLSGGLIFSQKGLSWGSKILYGVLNHNKKKSFVVKTFFGGPPHAPCWSIC